jgi:hypothetical protein
LKLENEKRLLETVREYVVKNYHDKQTQLIAFARFAPHIRWCYIPSQYLVEKVENDPFSISVPKMTNYLFEAYKYKSSNKTYKRPYERRKYDVGDLIFSKAQCGPALTITKNGLGLKKDSNNYQHSMCLTSAMFFEGFIL